MNRKIATIALAATGSLCAVAVLAQEIEGLDIKSIEARSEAMKADAQALFDYATSHDETHQDEAQAVVEDGYRQIEELNVSRMASATGPVDFDEIVAGARTGMARPKGAPLFVAFASLSMPEEALTTMIADTTRAGGVIVFRGFSAGNPRTFMSGIRKVVDESGASNIAIDPRLFRSFAVDRVPTYVALSTGFEPCDQLDCVTPPPPHDRIAGNVSVSYVLETFANAGGPGAPVARLGLANLRGQR
ncbi:MAG: type-F conjugative transfer system pilin assembly protein TrbC [Parvularcula sp.]|jgi:conjugal transfer pilus assembly protein TrbC|nr:type-F conjugative transfer system pilin assembly protein TrbC [Parvularcula sp.]